MPINTGKNLLTFFVDYEPDTTMCKINPRVDFAISSAPDRWSSFLTTAHQLDREHTPKELASDKNIVKAIAAIDRMFNEEELQSL